MHLNIPANKVHGANMGPTRVLSAPDGPHVGPINLAIRDVVCKMEVLLIGLNVFKSEQAPVVSYIYCIYYAHNFVLDFFLICLAGFVIHFSYSWGLLPWHSDCPSTSGVTLEDMGKIDHNQKDKKHNNVWTVFIFVGYVLYNTVRCHYNIVKFLTNIH